MKGKGGVVWTREQAEKFVRTTGNAQVAEALSMPKLGAGKALAVPLEPSGPSTGPAAPKAKKPKRRSRTEEEFELILLKRFPDCDIRYEEYTFKLADDCRYTPDFAVIHKNEHIEFFEVKGAYLFRGATKSATASSLTKPKVAAAKFRHRFNVAQKIDGRWEETVLRGLIDT